MSPTGRARYERHRPRSRRVSARRGLAQPAAVDSATPLPGAAAPAHIARLFTDAAPGSVLGGALWRVALPATHPRPVALDEHDDAVLADYLPERDWDFPRLRLRAHHRFPT